MIKTWIANRLVRKIVVFSLVFVIAGAVMGVQLALTPDAYAAESRGFAAVTRMSMTHDGQAVAASALMDDGLLTLEDLVQPISTEPHQGDYVVFRSGDERTSPREDSDSDAKEEAAAPCGEADVVYAPSARPKVEEEQEDMTEREDKQDIADGFVYLSQLPIDEPLQRYTWERCEEQGVDYALVLALMWRESRFETQAVNLNRNGTRDSGIMQINDVNKAWLHRELAIDNLMDPYQNINAGTEILGRLVEKYGEHDALMAYQYGEAGMLRKKRQGVSTNRQIEALYVKQAEYQEMLDNAAEEDEDE